MANDFYVHIVESPSPAELLDGITEGRALREFLDIAGIQYSYNLAVDLDQFKIAMKDRIVASIKEHRKIPILHLSMHGSEQGIQLTNQYGTEDLIFWPQLAGYLRSIHEAIDRKLGVCMSCCGGAYGIRMAKVISEEKIPCRWIMGSFSDIDLCDAALAYATFYRRIHRGIDDVNDLIQALRVASGISDLVVLRSERIQKVYRKKQIEEIIEKFLSSR